MVNMDFEVITPPSGKWNKVEVKPSPGKGNGVFATKKIKKGEAICWYDGVFCKVYDKYWMNNAPVFITGKTGYNQNTKYYPDKDYYDCLAGTTRELRKGGVASLINDYSNSADPEVILKNLLYKRYNCDKQITYDEDGNFKSYIVVAEKNIELGEELFVCYGDKYWTCADKKWKEEDIKNIVQEKNPDYSQSHNSIEDYITRAKIVKNL